MRRVEGFRLPDTTEPGFDVFEVEGESEWLAFRNEGVGGSDVASIMGISRYRSPVEVWMEKRGMRQPADLSDKEAVEWGNRLEAVIRDTFAEKHPEFSVSTLGYSLVAKDRPWAHANLDGTILGDDGWGVLEIKTVGKNREKDWADSVPDYYMTQVTHYLSVTGWSYAYVAALIGGQHYVEYRVERDEDDIAMVDAAVDTFWNDCVVGGALPQVIGTQSEAGAMLDMFGIGSTDYAVPENKAHFDTLVHDYLEAKECERRYAERAKTLANDIRAAIGSERGALSDVYKVTWVKTNSSRFDKKRFAQENPDLLAKYTTTCLKDGGLRVSEVR